MTSFNFDSNLKGILRNFGTDSLKVLKLLMAEDNYDSIEADTEFANRATAYFLDDRNIWRRERNGLYKFCDQASTDARDAKLEDMSFYMSMDPERVRAIITRVFNSIYRTQGSVIGNPFKKAFEITYSDVERAFSEVEKEA